MQASSSGVKPSDSTEPRRSSDWRASKVGTSASCCTLSCGADEDAFMPRGLAAGLAAAAAFCAIAALTRLARSTELSRCRAFHALIGSFASFAMSVSASVGATASTRSPAAASHAPSPATCHAALMRSGSAASQSAWRQNAVG